MAAARKRDVVHGIGVGVHEGIYNQRNNQRGERRRGGGADHFPPLRRLAVAGEKREWGASGGVLADGGGDLPSNEDDVA